MALNSFKTKESQQNEATKCFVVMPFGEKPFLEGSNLTYNFDKVYRVIIQRAIREAGMQPIRADERIGSAIIHSDMFKDLRDQSIVLADLSLGNPNVFYELGIRHVMASSGTVLICRKGYTLPFDVHLSRVIFYDFDGQSLDWEETERVVEKLQLALQEAKRGEPDSPVHALLETVFKPDNVQTTSENLLMEDFQQTEELIKYQNYIAQCWKDTQLNIESLMMEHKKSIFGMRALAYYCLLFPERPEATKEIAAYLSDMQQYKLSVELYTQLQTEGNMNDYNHLLKFASVYSEYYPDLKGVNHAIKLIKKAMSLVKKEFMTTNASDHLEALEAKGQCYRHFAGLLQWKWQLTKEEKNLSNAIQAHANALFYMEQARTLGNFAHPGLIAQSHLKSMLLLRIQEDDINRGDAEGHREAILNLNPKPQDDAMGLSYLNWFQAITLADSGAAEASQRKALKTFSEDAKIMGEANYWEIGRRQYVRLRRFIEQYSYCLKNSSLIGSISQILQAGHQPKG
jgi:hypothetical protein